MGNAIYGSGARQGKNKIKGKRNTARLLLLWLAILAVAIVPRIVQEPSEKAAYKLLDVIDGDTISVLYEQETVNVRLIGVDAPESVHPDEDSNTEFGVQASQYMEKLLAQTTYVYLEFDEERYDSYGRLLAYVYLQDGATFEDSVNCRLAADGYAVNKEYRPNVMYAEELATACREAREQQKGLWGLEGIQKLWTDTIP